jgi:hypothetical protein
MLKSRINQYIKVAWKNKSKHNSILCLYIHIRPIIVFHYKSLYSTRVRYSDRRKETKKKKDETYNNDIELCELM